jgi:hypothetical protein
MTSSSEIESAEKELRSMDRLIRDTIRGGLNVSRDYKISVTGKIDIIPEEDALQYKKNVDANIFEYLSRKLTKNIITISGADVSCYEQDANNDGNLDFVLEDTYVKFALQKVSKASPMPDIDTKDNIILMMEKTYNTTINLTNSSIVINDNLTTSYGTGYSEILRSGRNVPECTVHFYVNSTEGTDYDIYYKLYAGADFLAIDVRNI